MRNFSLEPPLGPTKLHHMDHKKELYVFRHGETDWNLEKRFQGHTNIPLNDTGRRQAKGLRQTAAQLPIDLILTSDLLRARETAEIVFAGRNIPMQVSSALREARLGAPEGQLLSEIIAKYGEQSWQQWRSVTEEDLDFAFPGGESKREHLNRVCRFLEETLTQSPARRIAISTHGGVVRRLVHFCAGAPSEPVPIPNCQIYKLIFNRGDWIYAGNLQDSTSPTV